MEKHVNTYTLIVVIKQNNKNFKLHVNRWYDHSNEQCTIQCIHSDTAVE